MLFSARRAGLLLPLVLLGHAFVLGTGTASAADHALQTAARVDQLVRSESGQGTAAERADDETFLRRVFLDLIGQPPTVEDVLAFSLNSDPQRREAVVDTLLADRQFGENWSRYWRDVIMYRRTEPRALIAANSFTEYLAERLNRNTPWDEIATDIITASGDVRENGSTALIMAQAGMPEDVSAEVARIFLGIQIQCAQCHDHPSEDWQREQFHQLAAFFPRVAVRPTRSGEDRSFAVTVNDRAFARRRANNNNRFAGTPEHHMPDLDDPSSPGTLVQPVFFLNGKQVPLGTRDAERRGTLAEWITGKDNPWFARAFVNRVWAELIGEGFYEPVDDLGPEREPTAPQTLDYLAHAFQNTGYDVKWLYRTILLTETYQQDSRSRRDFDEPAFTANCARRLRGDQLYDALVAALNLQVRSGPLAQGNGYRAGGPRALLNNVFGYDPSDPRDEISGSIPQALALMNSPFIDRAINARRPDGLGEILRRHTRDADALTELYLKMLSRAPSDHELRTCLDYIRRVDDRAEAYEDIQWALLNSTAFLYRQ